MPPLMAFGVNKRQSVIPAKSLVMMQHRANLQHYLPFSNRQRGFIGTGRLDGLKDSTNFCMCVPQRSHVGQS